MLVVLCIRSLRNKIELFDLYTKEHSDELLKPIILQKTFIGGLFSLIFLGAAIFVIGSTIMAYMMDNIIETKALMPVLVLLNSVTAFTANTITV